MAANLWATDDGVYFGYACDHSEGKPPVFDQRMVLPYVGDRHIVTLGPNGSGKSRRLLLPNLARLPNWSILVVDPKGDLATMTASYRANRGNKIVMLNPFNVLGLGSNGFNPVAALDPKSDDFPDDALGLAEALVRVQGQEPHWSEVRPRPLGGAHHVLAPHRSRMADRLAMSAPSSANRHRNSASLSER